MSDDHDVLRVAICNERFLTRFGVDRILVLLASHLAELGHEIMFVCLRADVAKLEQITSNVIILDAPDEGNLIDFDRLIAGSVASGLRAAGIDVVVCGGWPFFTTAACASSFGARSLFIDAGAVPHSGFPTEALSIQREVKRLRESALPCIDFVSPISRFIEESQSLPDRGHDRNVQVANLGADHLSSEGPPTGRDERALISRLDDLRAQGQHLVLALGRMEKFGYKNSYAVFDVFRVILKARANVKLLVLIGTEHFELPSDLKDNIIALSTISDAALQALMQRCSLGLSLSLWEGFNLPVAEMQWTGRPVLAFAVGAHPEVIVDPWFLCHSLEEMTFKAIEVIAASPPAVIVQLNRYEIFRKKFTWKTTLSCWTSMVFGLSRLDVRQTRRLIIVDVTNSARDPANSGVIRVTRRLTAQLVKHPDLTVLFAKWDGGLGEFVRLSGSDHGFLSSNSGPTDGAGQAMEKFGAPLSLAPLLQFLAASNTVKPVFFFTEVILDGLSESRVKWARDHGCATGFVFYDMLPITETKFVSSDVAENFPSYLASLNAADAMYAISNFSLEEYESWRGHEHTIKPRCREAIWLPAQFSDRPRVLSSSPQMGPIEVLCVSTIEPRKNHRILVDAFTLLLRQTDVSIRLNLVGNSYAGEHGLSDWIRTVCAEQPAIVWHGIVNDEALDRLYRQAYFTVYPSLAEGYGLPIMESLWMACPCICHERGVMVELAAPGGCLTVDMTNASSLAGAMARLLADRHLHRTLSDEAGQRQLSDWPSYGDKIAAKLVCLEG